MSDIFISYKREEQEEARDLVIALEKLGWHVLWDPNYRKNEYDDGLIEMARDEAKCIIALWSPRSVTSRFVKDDAAYGFDHEKLVSVIIEEVKLPVRFSKIQTRQLIKRNGLLNNQEFCHLVKDISAITGCPAEQTYDEEKVPGTIFCDTLKDSSQGPEMVIIPAGRFDMGDAWEDGYECEKPVHTVHIRRPFALSRFLITFEQYDTFAKNTDQRFPRDNSWGRGKQPVIDISWKDAKTYAEWLSQQTGEHYRLPSESEWEYAACSGKKKDKWAGTSIETELGNYAWYDQNSEGRVHPVGMKKPNGMGLYDMSGNVWEWVEDCWHEDGYLGAPNEGSVWQSYGEDCELREPRILRGGSWNCGAKSARSAHRHVYVPEHHYNIFGFRLARDL